MLSIVRIIVGLLYMEHGLAKVLGFPLQPNHAPYALFNLNPGLQGLLELVGGLLLALGLFTRTVALDVDPTRRLDEQQDLHIMLQTATEQNLLLIAARERRK